MLTESEMVLFELSFLTHQSRRVRSIYGTEGALVASLLTAAGCMAGYELSC
jgi:hypothetical protein